MRLKKTLIGLLTSYYTVPYGKCVPILKYNPAGTLAKAVNNKTNDNH